MPDEEKDIYGMNLGDYPSRRQSDGYFADNKKKVNRTD